VTASVVSAFANAGPLTIVLGFMSLTAIMPDVGTLMAAALAIGIALDDPIHLPARYFRYRHGSAAARTAALLTRDHIGAPVAHTSFTLAAAFPGFPVMCARRSMAGSRHRCLLFPVTARESH
jgi:uncharacterized protein